MAGHLRWRAGDDEIAADTAPVTFAEFVEAEEEQAVLLLGPRDALAALLVAGGLVGSGRSPCLRPGTRPCALDALVSNDPRRGRA